MFVTQMRLAKYVLQEETWFEIQGYFFLVSGDFRVLNQRVQWAEEQERERSQVAAYFREGAQRGEYDICWAPSELL